MQYRIDPKSGNALSVLGFGCMRFPRGLTAQIDAEKTERLIRAAVEGGVNYFDTAYIYSGSEAVLGEILCKNKLREKIFLATKLPLGQCRRSEDFERLFCTQLERLKTDYIDYYLIHNLPDVPLWRSLCDLGIEAWLAEKKAERRIRQVGFSFHGARRAFAELLDEYDWDFCQIQYNYMDENYQAGRAGLRLAHGRGLPVIVMEPLLGGKLANGLPAKAIRHFKEAGGGSSAAAWAFRWLWDQPEVTVVLSGMNSAEQLADNLKTAETAAPGMLSEREAAAFAPAVAALREAYRIPCTGCNYCMPCPQGVNIPGCFAAYNASYAMGFVVGMQQYITGTGVSHAERRSAGGRNCVKCGVCEKKCPQHIGIVRALESVTKRMEPFWFNAMIWVIRRLLS
ncbi:MAG: aldo/keto reductase [Clostridiales Family XIII bacterium]|jgi:predicted aldo/keto reductase-like oxidoreductase|nr:aldo/keto reductase [Clostridiales Family XIII bacterium]